MTTLAIPADDAARFALITERLYVAVIGDVLDQLGRTHQFLPANVRPILPSMKLVGRAMPVLISDVYGQQTKPFGLMTEALDQLQTGEIYLATGGTTPCSAWGELLTATARMRGATGAVLNSYHRDTPKILSQDWPVFSWGAFAQDAGVRSSVLDFRLPVEIAGVRVTPGDLVVGDLDGVLVVPQDIETEVLERAAEKASTENLVLKAILEGMSSTEALATFGVL
jgi:regulator of RNase E activity RraA